MLQIDHRLVTCANSADVLPDQRTARDDPVVPDGNTIPRVGYLIESFGILRYISKFDTSYRARLAHRKLDMSNCCTSRESSVQDRDGRTVRG